MGLFSFLNSSKKKYSHDALIWETSTLSKTSLVPLMKEFPELEELAHPNLIIAWDVMVTIAMTGLAAKTRGYLDNSASIEELKRELKNKLKSGDLLFNDYLEYSTAQSERVSAPWSAISAMWLSENLMQIPNISEKFKSFISNLKAVNILSSYMSIAYGNTDLGFSQFMNEMCLSIEKDKGINMGLNTHGTKKDPKMKMMLLAQVFEQFACNSAKMIKEIYK